MNADFFRLSGIVPFAFPFVPKVRAFFSTALTGNFSLDAHLPEEDTKATRRLLHETLPLSAWVELKQVHGTAVLKDPMPTPFFSRGVEEADGACTERPGFGLIIKTADCQPLLLAHSSGKYVAALHVGWRGNAARLPVSGVRDFCAAYGLQARDVLVVRGPSLGPERAEFVNYRKEWPADFHHLVKPETRTMDLWSLTREQLLEAGVLSGNIYGLDLCTASLPGLLFSYRRKDAARQIGMIWREE